MSEHWVTDPSAAITLKIAPTGFGAIPPRTVTQQFNATVAKHGDRKAMAVKDTNGKVTYESLYRCNSLSDILDTLSEIAGLENLDLEAIPR